MISLIACDIDGTLLRDGQTAPDPELFPQIRRLAEKGIRFCPASGRQYHSLRLLFAPVADDLLYICENGGSVYDRDQALYHHRIPRQEALALIRDILATPECEVLISGPDMSYLCTDNREYVEFFSKLTHNNITLVQDVEEVPDPIIKVSAYRKAGAAPLDKPFREKWGDRFQVAVSGFPWLDFNQSDKGTGLDVVCRRLGISPENVAAFGDNYNDVPILTKVGHPWLMENAAEELLRRFPNHCAGVVDILKTL